MSKKTKPYKLSQISAEVNRLNTVADTMPETWKPGQPSAEWIDKRIKSLRNK